MPLYEYQCDVCGHRFEVIQKFSDPHIDTCAKCGGTVHKLFSSPAIQFKGSGFYITDYPRQGKSDKTTAGAEKSEGRGSGSSESKSESSSDSKSATESRNQGDSGSKTETKSESKTESSTSSSAPKE